MMVAVAGKLTNMIGIDDADPMAADKCRI